MNGTREERSAIVNHGTPSSSPTPLLVEILSPFFLTEESIECEF